MSISASPSQLRSAVGEIDDAVAGLAHAREHLQAANGRLDTDDIDGGFDEFVARWDGELDAVSGLLDGMRHALEAAAVAYDQVDADVSGTIRREQHRGGPAAH